MSFQVLNQAAKEILALAVCETFPKTELLGGEVSEINFTYSFVFSPNVIHKFSKAELQRIEDQMHLISYQGRPISILEMMPDNAAMLFEHLGQPTLAQEATDSPSTLISVIKIGEHYALNGTPLPKDTSACPFFKLLDFQKEGDVITIYGVASLQRSGLKELCKRFRDAQKKDYRKAGAQLGILTCEGEGWIYLPKGLEIREEFLEKRKSLYKKFGFHFLSSYLHEDFRTISRKYLQLIRPQLPFKIAALKDHEDQFAIFCTPTKASDEVISSLQFIEETIKIFGFERRIYFQGTTRKKEAFNSLMLDAMECLKLPFEKEKLIEGKEIIEPTIEFRLLDAFGYGVKGPVLTIDPRSSTLFGSLFGTIDWWIALSLEQWQ